MWRNSRFDYDAHPIARSENCFLRDFDRNVIDVCIGKKHHIVF